MVVHHDHAPTGTYGEVKDPYVTSIRDFIGGPLFFGNYIVGISPKMKEEEEEAETNAQAYV